MLGLSIIKLHLIFMFHFMKIYKFWFCGMRNTLKVEFLFVICFYYYFHVHKPWEFYYASNFHKSLRITEKLLLRSDYVFHSFIKVYFVEIFFFPFLLPYAWVFFINDFHHYYLTINKNKQSKRSEEEKEVAQVLLFKLTHISYVSLGTSLNFSMSVSTSV